MVTFAFVFSVFREEVEQCEQLKLLANKDAAKSVQFRGLLPQEDQKVGGKAGTEEKTTELPNAQAEGKEGPGKMHHYDSGKGLQLCSFSSPWYRTSTQ
jgi:hypothetical protein